MRTVTKRELNQRTAQVLAQVTHGEQVVVTEHGVPRWQIDVVKPEIDTVGKLRALGKVIPPRTDPAPWPDDEALYTPQPVDALYDESRGDH